MTSSNNNCCKNCTAYESKVGHDWTYCANSSCKCHTKYAGCKECLDSAATTGEQCVQMRDCECHYKTARTQERDRIVEMVRGMKRNLPEKERYGSGMGMWNAALDAIISKIEKV